eukprot:2416773-Rhodomonas_salina.1
MPTPDSASANPFPLCPVTAVAEPAPPLLLAKMAAGQQKWRRHYQQKWRRLKWVSHSTWEWHSLRKYRTAHSTFLCKYWTHHSTFLCTYWTAHSTFVCKYWTSHSTFLCRYWTAHSTCT